MCSNFESIDRRDLYKGWCSIEARILRFKIIGLTTYYKVVVYDYIVKILSLV